MRSHAFGKIAAIQTVACLALPFLVIIVPCRATVLPFNERLSTTGNGPVETFSGTGSAYGDRVSSTTDANGFTYLAGSGFTPHVVTDFSFTGADFFFTTQAHSDQPRAGAPSIPRSFSK